MDISEGKKRMLLQAFLMITIIGWIVGLLNLECDYQKALYPEFLFNRFCK